MSSAAMKPSAMPYDHQLPLVIMVRMPAAIVAAMAALPQIARRRDWSVRPAVAAMTRIAPTARPTAIRPAYSCRHCGNDAG